MGKKTNTYVIMKKAYSPIAITAAMPHLVWFDRKEAYEKAKMLNEKATNNEYWVVKVKNTNDFLQKIEVRGKENGK